MANIVIGTVHNFLWQGVFTPARNITVTAVRDGAAAETLTGTVTQDVDTGLGSFAWVVSGDAASVFTVSVTAEDTEDTENPDQVIVLDPVGIVLPDGVINVIHSYLPVDDRGADSYSFMPTIDTMANGDQICCWRGTTNGGGHILNQYAGVFFSKRINGVGDWSNYVSVFTPDATWAYFNGVMTRFVDGSNNEKIIICAQKDKYADINNVDSRIVAKISSDGGDTWSAAIPVSTTAMSVGVQMCQTPTGRLIFSALWYAQNLYSGNQPVSIFYSDDYGVTWIEVPILLDQHGTGHTYNEGCVFNMADGKLGCFLRNEAAPNVYGKMFSTNNGITWSAITDLALPVNPADQVGIQVCKDWNDEYIVTHNDLIYHFDEACDTFDLIGALPSGTFYPAQDYVREGIVTFVFCKYLGGEITAPPFPIFSENLGFTYYAYSRGAWKYPNSKYRIPIQLPPLESGTDRSNTVNLLQFVTNTLKTHYIANALANGADTIITDYEGNKLYRDVLICNGTDFPKIEVKLGTYTAIGETLYLYYGDSDGAETQRQTGAYPASIEGFYTCDEASGAVYDNTANGRNASTNGTQNQDGVTALSKSILIDAVAETITIPRATVAGKENYEISFWYKVPATGWGAGTRYLFCKQSATDYDKSAYLTSTLLLFRQYDVTNPTVWYTSTQCPNTPLLDYKWHKLSFVKSNTFALHSVKIYIDGKRQDFANDIYGGSGAAVSNANVDLSIGGVTSWASAAFGNYSNIKILSTPLSDEQRFFEYQNELQNGEQWYQNGSVERKRSGGGGGGLRLSLDIGL